MFPMVDSSPQGGRDYEMVLLHIVRKSDLASLHEDVTYLVRGMRVLSLEERAAELEPEQELMDMEQQEQHYFQGWSE